MTLPTVGGWGTLGFLLFAAGVLAAVGKIDWGAIFNRAVLIALKQMSPADAEDVVGEGIERVYDGRAPWDPAGGRKLEEHVVGVGYNVRRNEQRKARRRERGEFTAQLEQDMKGAQPASPEDAYADQELRARRFRQLWDMCDAEERAVLEAEERGIAGLEAQMEYTKMSRDKLRNVRKRVGRRLETVLEQEKKEAAQ